jgi:hypothetical protein
VVYAARVASPRLKNDGGKVGCQTRSHDAEYARVSEALIISLQFDLHFLDPPFVRLAKKTGGIRPLPPKMRTVINLSVSQIFRGKADIALEDVGNVSVQSRIVPKCLASPDMFLP